MKNIDFYNVIDEIAPFASALSFDNVGLLVGDKNTEVTAVLICLDITDEVIEEAIKTNSSLIISHHPVIFNAIKSVDSMLYKLISNGLSVISCHTNFDLCDSIGVNKAFADKLEIENIERVDDYYQFNIDEMSVEDFAKKIKKNFPQVQYSNLNRKIKKVAMCSGSGSGAFEVLRDDVDAFVTGELRHDIWLKAREKNIALFAMGHYETEVIYNEYMCKLLKEKFSQIKIEVSKNEVNPIKYLN